MVKRSKKKVKNNLKLFTVKSVFEFKKLENLKYLVYIDCKKYFETEYFAHILI